MMIWLQKNLLRAWWIAAWVALFLGTAQAQPIDLDTSDAIQQADVVQDDADVIASEGSWNENTSVKDREFAFAIFLDGNKKLKNGFFKDAVERYQDAIDVWPHPAFHFNLSVALRLSDQPIKARELLLTAMEHGAEGLGKGKFEYAQRMLEEIEGQLGHITVICDEEDAEVTLDGVVLFIAPDEKTLFVRPGNHQLVASKDKFIPDTKPIAPLPGEKMTIKLDVTPRDSLIVMRNWAAWKPWSVLGAGGVVTLAAALLDFTSSRGFDDFDNEFSNRCPAGCATSRDPELQRQLNAATRNKWLARGAYIAASGLLVTGALLTYINRERLVRVKPREEEAPGMSITPVLTTKSAELTATFRF